MRAPMRPRLWSRRENLHVASFIQLHAVRELKEQDKRAGEHQRGHPD